MSGTRKRKQVKKQSIIPIVVITSVICFLIVFSVLFALININNDKILSKIDIMGIDVSKLGKQEAINKLLELTEKQLTGEITLKHEEFETTINGKQFSMKFDIEKAVNEAYNIGKDGNIVVNNYKILWTRVIWKKYRTSCIL